MPNLNEIEKYVIIGQIVKSEKKDEYINNIESDIVDDIQDSLDSGKEKILSFTATSLDLGKSLYGTVYLSDVFTTPNSISNEFLCKYYMASIAGIFCDYYNNKNERFNNGLAYQGEMLLMSFACNKFDLIEHCYPKIKESLLNGKMSKSLAWGGDGEGNIVPPTPQRLGVLAIEMMASEYKQTIDWHSVNIPTDPFYVRFCQEALYEKDENIVKEWLVELCDNHLKWASLFLDNNKSSITGHEIEQPVLLLWPFEYQAVKNFRARHGLTTPEVDHPLLKTSMAIDHRPDFNQWHKPEWFQPVMDKLKEANPALAFLPALFK
ncbi:hypothetical protein [Serratia fonticola]|uniref:Cytoplasmic protein n=1 Tax=Serratia fonticola TaxID=47917 RepID=A0AAW3WJG0_SERFO|nr:hypothetical protein [Serratia fonticola]ERK15343.1 putative cytoplasmic protein [Serratia fonticola AU-P3(3)]MBC3210715.1 hypothetical protein [Serratia fonticola]NYA11697.1 hypothetical protein [Serratia fonticola]NYA32741.1 hypothetical protein [Serratia fonticola]